MGIYKPTKLKIFIALLLFLFLAPFIGARQCQPLAPGGAPPNIFHCPPMQISLIHFILILFKVSPFIIPDMPMDFQYTLLYSILFLSLLLSCPISCILVYLLKNRSK